MVNLHFPPNLTEEELMLQAKYEKLRKKKKALENLKAPKVEPERPVIKRPKIEAKNAKEIAKKLIRSGAIAAIQKTQRREEQGSGFKRPCGLERKLERNNSHSSYQPFSSSHSSEPIDEKPVISKKLYATHDDDRDEAVIKPTIKSSSAFNPSQSGKVTNTLLVVVNSSEKMNLTEEFLSSTFEPYGNVVNINIEVDKHRAFIAYDKVESATAALTSVSSMDNVFPMKLSYAKSRPMYKSNPDSSSPMWANQGTMPAQKESPREDRQKVDYSDVMSDIFV